MQLIRGLHNIRQEHRGCVATIGNFDGVHLGHRTMLKELRRQAQKRSANMCVITFEPLPREHFSTGEMPARLTRLREKLFLLEQCGVDQVVCLSFGEKLSSVHANDFVKNILVSGLGIKYLVVGDDFRFGHERMGCFSYLCEMGGQYGFEVDDTGSVAINGRRISSTDIRKALQAGYLEKASRLLGQPLIRIGRVIKGQQLGRELGFPTANIAIDRRKSPIKGVFAVKVCFQGRRYDAVANLGIRPTVTVGATLLEVHILDFNEQLYGCELRVEFIKKIRDERKFHSLGALTAAIADDVRAVRSLKKVTRSELLSS